MFERLSSDAYTPNGRGNCEQQRTAADSEGMPRSSERHARARLAAQAI